MNRKFNPFTFYRMVIRLTTFLGLSAIPLFYYPGFHQFYAWNIGTVVGTEFWMNLTKYNTLRYGGIHMPTAYLMFSICLAAFATPYVARAIEAGIDIATGRLLIAFKNRELPEDAPEPTVY